MGLQFLRPQFPTAGPTLKHDHISDQNLKYGKTVSLPRVKYSTNPLDSIISYFKPVLDGIYDCFSFSRPRYPPFLGSVQKDTEALLYHNRKSNNFCDQILPSTKFHHLLGTDNKFNTLGNIISYS